MRGEVAGESSISRPTLTELACQAMVGHLPTPELIAAVIREAIVSGALSGRAQLRQSELAATFGVSIIPVREGSAAAGRGRFCLSATESQRHRCRYFGRRHQGAV